MPKIQPGNQGAGLLKTPGFRERVEWKRTSRKYPCPVCGRYGWCEVSGDGALVHCMYTPGERSIKWRGGGWIHELRPALPNSTVSKAFQAEQPLSVTEQEIKPLPPRL